MFFKKENAHRIVGGNVSGNNEIVPKWLVTTESKPMKQNDSVSSLYITFIVHYQPADYSFSNRSFSTKLRCRIDLQLKSLNFPSNFHWRARRSVFNFSRLSHIYDWIRYGLSAKANSPPHMGEIERQFNEIKSSSVKIFTPGIINYCLSFSGFSIEKIEKFNVLNIDFAPFCSLLTLPKNSTKCRCACQIEYKLNLKLARVYKKYMENLGA